MKFRSKKEQRQVEERLAKRHLTLWELTDKARDIRGVYARVRKEYYPNYDLRGDPDLHIWERVALHMIENEIDPVLYIGLAFHYIGSDARPNHMLSAQIQERFKERLADSSKRAEKEIQMALTSFRLLVRRFGITSRRKILTDPTNSFSALFIWTMAGVLGLDDLREQYTGQIKMLRVRDPVRVTAFISHFGKQGVSDVSTTSSK